MMSLIVPNPYIVGEIARAIHRTHTNLKVGDAVEIPVVLRNFAYAALAPCSRIQWLCLTIKLLRMSLGIGQIDNDGVPADFTIVINSTHLRTERVVGTFGRVILGLGRSIVG